MAKKKKKLWAKDFLFKYYSKEMLGCHDDILTIDSQQLSLVKHWNNSEKLNTIYNHNNKILFLWPAPIKGIGKKKYSLKI